MVSSSESIKPQPTSSEELSHTSPSDTHPERPSEKLFSREDTERSTSRESLFLPTPSSRNHWESKVFTMLKILSMRSTLLVLTSRRPTTSSGPSNSELPEEDLPTRDTPSKEEEIGETENNTSTN